MPETTFDKQVILDAIMLKYFGVRDVSLLKRRHYVRFAKVLGFPSGDDLIVDILNPEVMRIIALLNGPHWKTVLKIIEARKGDNNANPDRR